MVLSLLLLHLWQRLCFKRDGSFDKRRVKITAGSRLIGEAFGTKKEELHYAANINT